MLSSEIIDFFAKYSHLNKWFLGCFSLDTIPSNIPVNYYLICNQDKSFQPGSHWWALYRSSATSIEFFDSLGVDESKATHLCSLIKIKKLKEIEFNETVLQAKDSVSCGEFCLFFLFNRLHNLDYSFDETLNDIFYTDTSLNEQAVTKFYEKYKHGFIN